MITWLIDHSEFFCKLDTFFKIYYLILIHDFYLKVTHLHPQDWFATTHIKKYPSWNNIVLYLYSLCGVSMLFLLTRRIFPDFVWACYVSSRERRRGEASVCTHHRVQHPQCQCPWWRCSRSQAAPITTVRSITMKSTIARSLYEILFGC